MAHVNGFSPNEDTVAVVTTHLGKRKRTPSPIPAPAPSNTKVADPSLQLALQDILNLFRKYDTSPSLLNYPLHHSATDSPNAKRTRLLKLEETNDNIESRILAGTYPSLGSLSEDVKTVQSAILKDLSLPSANGKDESTNNNAQTEEKLKKLVELLDVFTTRPPKPINGHAIESSEDGSPGQEESFRPIGQVLSLRTQINGQAHYLYSGLGNTRSATSSSDDADAQVRDVGLPNGLEVTDFTSLSKDQKAKSPVKRTFGEVFRFNPVGNKCRPLDPPRSTTVRTNTLQFSNRPKLWDQNPNHNDYKNARLESGLWLSYGSNSSFSQPRTASIDLSASIINQNDAQWSPSGTDDLFTSAYSSFAPASDNSSSLTSSSERGQAWWRQFGAQKMSSMFGRHAVEEATSDEAKGGVDEDEFADLVSDFIPAEDGEFGETREEIDDVDALLQELSELIEILSSHQKVRSLNAPISNSADSEPPKLEIDTFETIRTQIRILVAALPPYAVAKLNGDQLEELNISTKIVVQSTDFAGTGQVDDYVLKRQRAALAATSAASRSVPGAQARAGYPQTQITPGPYNPQARGYNPAIPATAAYGVRNTATYQTPAAARPPYSQTPYQAQNTPYNNRPTIQQFQRPIQQNGYANGSNTPYTAAPTPGFVQRPSQPGYQQRAQNSAFANRSASPQKPVVNGQAYPARPPSQNQYPYQRQVPGTPSTPSYATTAAAIPARYDGTSDRPNTDAGGQSSGPTPQQSMSPAANLSQTVEVSR